MLLECYGNLHIFCLWPSMWCVDGCARLRLDRVQRRDKKNGWNQRLYRLAHAKVRLHCPLLASVRDNCLPHRTRAILTAPRNHYPMQTAALGSGALLMVERYILLRAGMLARLCCSKPWGHGSKEQLECIQLRLINSGR